MADQFRSLKYSVQEDIFDAKSLLDENNFYHQRQGSPSELSRKLTYILGDYTKDYPISLSTSGGIGYDGQALKRAAVELDDVQFTYPVMGRNGKVAVCQGSPYQAGDKPGIGNTPFYIYLDDNWIKRFKIIQSSHGIQAYVLDDPEPLEGNGGFKYKVQLDPALPSDSCPLTELAYGVQWVDLTSNVPESESRGTEVGMVMPGMFKNQMGFHRLSMAWAGNSANKVMKINVTNSKGESTNVWMDFFMWQFEKEWLSLNEHAAWYSRYNRMPNGEIALKDLFTGKVIPRGSGLLEQIPNTSTYSSLTYDFLANKIGDALFNTEGNNSITLYTGTGGIREFDRAMKKAGYNLLTDFAAIADKFVTGTGRSLMLGGFFDGFYHVDGYVIKVKKATIFDKGKIAQISPKHPESGLPLESYRMVFIDDSDYDGQPNIQHVEQKGRGFLDGVVPGLTPMPRSLGVLSNNSGSSATKYLATEQDKSSYHRFSSSGVQILRANRCFDLQCVAGL